MTKKVPVLDKILKSYSKCSTYQDVGTWTDANGSSSNFSTIFIRPDKFCFQLKSGKWTSILWNSGAQIFTYSESPGSTGLTPFDSLADAMRKELQKPVGFSLIPTLLSLDFFEVGQGFFENAFEGHDLDEDTYLYSSSWKPLLNVEIRVNKATKAISEISFTRDVWQDDLEKISCFSQSTKWVYTKACFNDDVVTKIFDYKPSKPSST